MPRREIDGHIDDRPELETLVTDLYKTPKAVADEAKALLPAGR